MPSGPRDTFSTCDLVVIADISYRQVDYMCRTGVLDCERPARGSGSQRRFTARHAACAWVLGRLAEMGAQRDALRRAFDALYGDESLWAGPVVVEADEGGWVVPVGEAHGHGWMVDPRCALVALAAFRGEPVDAVA